jgi:hypothetical protein
MGYRGKVTEQARARELRARGWTYDEVASELAVSKSSVSLWCRDVAVDDMLWTARAQARRVPEKASRRVAEIERLRAEGAARVAQLDEREFLVAGAALYAGEGAKADGCVKFVNTDPRAFRSRSSPSRIGLLPIRRSARPSTRWVAPASHTRLSPSTAPSWAW